MKFLKKNAGLVLLVIMLSGCKTVSFSRVQPDLIAYTKDFQAQAYKEAAGGSCPALNILADDYGFIRDQIRALQD